MRSWCDFLNRGWDSLLGLNLKFSATAIDPALGYHPFACG